MQIAVEVLLPGPGRVGGGHDGGDGVGGAHGQQYAGVRLPVWWKSAAAAAEV